MALNWFKNYGDLHEGVTSDTIRAAAEDPNENANVVAALASELGEDEQHVAADIEGDISAGTRTNPAQVQQAATELAQAGYYAVALLKSFATSVDTFDDGVEELNDQLRRDTASAQRYAGQAAQHTDDEPPTYEESFNRIREYLEPRYRDLDDALETDAEDIAAKFEQGPTPANVKELVLAGLIPLSVAAAQWPDLTLSPDERRQALQNGINNGTIPDFSQMSAEEVEQYIAQNPQISDEIVPLMADPALSPELQALVDAQARLDAELASEAADADPSAENYEQIRAATERLEAINSSIADDDGELTAAQASYIETWTNTAGAATLAALPSAARASAAYAGPPSDVDRLTQQAISPVADAILNYGNPDVHHPDAGVAAPSGPPHHELVVYPNHMPEAIQDLVNGRIGHEGLQGTRYGTEYSPENSGPLADADHPDLFPQNFSSIDGYEQFKGWADLLSSASDGVEPGTSFSNALAEQAITAKQDLNAITESGEGYWDQIHNQFGDGDPELDTRVDGSIFNDGPMSDLLDVAARSEDGSSQFLMGEENRRALLSMNWDDADGAVNLVAAGTDRDPDSGSGNTERQAAAAMAIFGDVAADPSAWNERMGEAMSDAVVDTGIRWHDTFGNQHVNANNVDPNGLDPLGRPVGPQIGLTADDSRSFLSFIAGAGDEDAVRFNGALKAYGDSLVSEALAGDDAGDLRQALQWAGRADGRVETSTLDWLRDQQEDDYDEDTARVIAENREINANRTAAGVVNSLGGRALGLIPGAGPWLSAGHAAISGPILDEVFQENDVPDYSEIKPEEREAALQTARQDADRTRDHRFANIMAGQYADDPRFEDLYAADGTLRPLTEIARTDRDLSALGRMSDAIFDDWNARNSIHVDADSEYGTYNTELEGTAVDLDRDDPDSVGNSHRAREYLYGENYDYWSDYGLSEDEVHDRDSERYDGERDDVPDLPGVLINNPYDVEHDEIGRN